VDRRKWSTFFAYGLVDEFAQLAMDLGGRPAGVGRWMAYQMPELHGESMGAMVAIKKALDPKDILTPGKLIHAVSKFDIKLPAAVMNLGTKSISMVHTLLADSGRRKRDARSNGSKGASEAAEMVEEERAEDLEEERAAMEAAEAGIDTETGDDSEGTKEG
jgi:hypothetical protein